MFQSSSNHKIDAKGRVIIPSRFKTVLKKDDTYGVMVTNMDGCLYAYTLSEWAEVVSRIERNESIDVDEFKRFFLGQANKCLCDKQDRINIPVRLRDYANLSKEIVLVGLNRRFEIWDKGKWDEKTKKLEQKLQTKEARKEIASMRL